VLISSGEEKWKREREKRREKREKRNEVFQIRVLCSCLKILGPKVPLERRRERKGCREYNQEKGLREFQA
jgi:hypothetical protein